MFKRSIFHTILSRLSESRRFIQVLSGPRQGGKTTLAQQVIEAIAMPSHYASADSPTLQDASWVQQQWEIARLKSPTGSKQNGALLILDEIQKIPRWSAIVKDLWDRDTRRKFPLHVMLLGSSPLLMQKGLTESLAGRFEVIPVPHWSYSEMKQAFGWELDRFIFYGGYPGSASLVDNLHRWSRYVLDSLVETTISRDILLMSRVDKPALLRRLFQLGCDYSGRVLSYQKMLGQLQDAGNTTTLAHYIDLLEGAGFLSGLQKFSNRRLLQRGSSPKLVILNTALITAASSVSFQEALVDREFWGHLVESAVGAYLKNNAGVAGAEVFYWLDRNREVDFVLRSGKTIVAIEVKSGRTRQALSGMEAFRRRFRVSRLLLVGTGGMDLEEFFQTPIQALLTPA